MDYLTIGETAELWAVSASYVLDLCNHNMIPGAIRSGMTWQIPENGKMPAAETMMPLSSSGITNAIQALGRDDEMLARIIEFFPYPIQVYIPDGTLILTNEACLRVLHIPSKEHIIGKFNVLTDPVIDQWGKNVRALIHRSFEGETVQFQDLKVPIRGIIDRFEAGELCLDNSFQNIICFPVYADNSELSYVVHVFVTTRLYDGRQELVMAKEYIETHWQEDFDLDKAAGAVGLSRYHFSRLFKSFAGMTPLSYYQTIKIGKIKEMLTDANLSIAEAFSACGVDYSGNYAQLFKEKVGMTPSQYRKTLK